MRRNDDWLGPTRRDLFMALRLREKLFLAAWIATLLIAALTLDWGSL